MTRTRRYGLLCGLTLVWGLLGEPVAWAQNSAEQGGASNLTIAWQRGKCVGQLGKVAQIDVPEDFQFAGPEGTAVWLQANGQRPSDRNVGVLLPASLAERWFLIFSYDPCGYVRDTDRTGLQPEVLLKTLQALTEASNPLRVASKLPPVQVLGWAIPPAYDEQTRHLSWITQVASGDQPSLNVGVRILGRHGVLTVGVVAMPDEIRGLLPTVKKLLAGVRFVPGEGYSEWREGDPVSSRTLPTLIVGEPRPASAAAQGPAAQGPAAPGAPVTLDSDRLANQVIMVLLAIGAVVLLILIYRLFSRMRPRG